MTIDDVPFYELARERYARYSRRVLGFRHFAEGRDGLLTVQRRVLWSMHQLGAVARGSQMTSSKVVGTCFAAGTAVSTVDGRRLIEDLDTSDVVVTSRGNHAVARTFDFDPRPTLRVRFHDARTIVCSLDQAFKVRIALDTYGWVHAHDLRPGDEVVAESVRHAPCGRAPLVMRRRRQPPRPAYEAAAPPARPLPHAVVYEVERGPVIPTFDIEVHVVHEFYAEGLCVKNCTGNLHPHGDAAVYGSLVGMSQINDQYPCVMGVGNFGWHDEKRAAASRYTKTYLTPYATTMMEPSALTQVPMDVTYDGKSTEPRYLPVMLPHLLIAGCSSIAVGHAGNIPPCDDAWVMNALHRTLDRQPLAPPSRFGHRWGGTLVSLDRAWLRTGKGSARFRPTVTHDGRRVLITTIAPGLRMGAMTDLMQNCPHLGSVSEESAEGAEIVRIVCTVRRGGDLRALFEHARRMVGRTQSYSFMHIRQFTSARGVDYEPVEEGPQSYLRKWVRWRLQIVSGAATHRADRHRAEIARVRVTLLAIARREQLLTALEKARDKADFVDRVGKILRCDVSNATRIADTPLHRLAKMNVRELHARIAEHERCIAVDDGIARAPHDRLVADARHAHEAMIASRDMGLQALKMPSGEKRGTRARQRTDEVG